MSPSPSHRLIVLYGVGGLSDVGRHAVLAALEHDTVASITVLTKYPKLLEESNWNCGCIQEHGSFSDKDKERIKIVPLQEYSDMEPHFEGATAVISCLGNRQPYHGHLDAFEGTTEILKAMKTHKVDRLVCMSSIGIAEDWPPVEWHWARWIMSCIFLTVGRSSYRDLASMEEAVRASDSDFLMIRPVGIPEDIAPVGTWYIQKKKWEDTPFFVMAKLDVARFMVGEAIQPTHHREAVVIGGEPKAET